MSRVKEAGWMDESAVATFDYILFDSLCQRQSEDIFTPP